MASSFLRTIRPDTRKLLITGAGTFGTGIVCAALTRFAFGGFGSQGPHTNAGWLCLMVSMGCLPTGFLTLLLAFAKVLGDRRREP